MEVMSILLLSFVPMLIYAAVLWWLDRFEKEPLYLLALAFLWGAVPSVLLSVIFEVILDVPITMLSGSTLAYELLGGSVVAPLIEEGAKALALILLFLFFRREIDSPLDGLVYGGMAGFGFAAVENAFYLFGAYGEGGMTDVTSLALLRAGLFGLNHAMYTGFTGLGIALALEMRSTWLKGLLPLLGFSLALAAHAYHNTFATFTGYVESPAPLVLAAVGDWIAIVFLFGVIIASRFLEQQHIRRFMERYADSLQFREEEIAMLTSPWKRWRIQAQALFTGNLQHWRKVVHYFNTITEAAFAFHRVQGGDAKADPRLQQLEQEIVALRMAA